MADLKAITLLSKRPQAFTVLLPHLPEVFFFTDLQSKNENGESYAQTTGTTNNGILVKRIWSNQVGFRIMRAHTRQRREPVVLLHVIKEEQKLAAFILKRFGGMPESSRLGYESANCVTWHVMSLQQPEPPAEFKLNLCLNCTMINVKTSPCMNHCSGYTTDNEKIISFVSWISVDCTMYETPPKNYCNCYQPLIMNKI